MSQSLPQEFAPGQIIAGKYRVERVLGQGGMGVVLAAQHIHLEERVAIKLMLAETATNGEAVARFVREARAAARLESAHVAKVSDVGTLEDGQPYMVMEYLDGQDLAHVLQTSGPLPVQEAVDCVLQASEAIAEAHSLGIIHRDLKPSNLFLTRRRDRRLHVKVLDFGISKVLNATRSGNDHAMTRTSALMGSPLYMSPEQMTAVKNVDARSDIWALGVILFELLTGSPPFMGDTLPEVCGLVIQSADPPASSRRPDLPRELDALIHRCLAKSPADRFQSVAELAFALQGLAGREGRAALERISVLSGGIEAAPAQPALPRVTGPVPSAVASNASPSTQAAWGETTPGTPGRRRRWLLIPLLGAPALAGAGWWFTLTKPSDVPPAPSSSNSVVTAAAVVPPAPAHSAIVVEPSPVESSPAPAAPATAVAPQPASLPPAPARGRALPIKKKSKDTAAVAAPPVAAAAAVPPPAAPPPVTTPKTNPDESKSSDLGGRL